MQGLPVILKRHNLQNLDKALDLFIKFKFSESDFYFPNRSKNCMVATYNFGSVYICIHSNLYMAPVGVTLLTIKNSNYTEGKKFSNILWGFTV